MSEKRMAEFLVGRLLEERPGWLSLNLQGELSQNAATRLIQFLEYFKAMGRLPDPDLERKILFHPLWSMTKDAPSRFEVCEYCRHLCSHLDCWQPCRKFNHPTTTLDLAHPSALELIYSSLEPEYERRCLEEEMNRRYPLPARRPDNTYICQTCRNPFVHQVASRDLDRLVCSEWCGFDLLGRPRIPGRSWPGFFTFYPSFKDGLVFYLGAVTLGMSEHLCECYLWQMKPGSGGHMYAYYGMGLKNYFTWISGAYANRDAEKKIAETGIRIDESWRILANTKDSYSWVTA